MAKVAAEATLSPSQFTPQAPVLLEDAVTVLEQVNYTAVHDTPVLLAVSPLQGPGWRWPQGPGLGFRRCAFGRMLVDADAETLRVVVEAECPSGDLGNVRVTVGGASVTLNMATGITTQVGSLPVASTGTGWLDFEVELERVVYTAANTNGLIALTVQRDRILPPNLPDPD